MLATLRHLLGSVFLTARFFWLGSSIVLLLALGYWYAPLFALGQAALAVLILVTLLEAQWLYAGGGPRLRVRRQLPRVLSLGDETSVRITVQNLSARHLSIEVIDELPIQLQERNFRRWLQLAPGSEDSLTYPVRPLERGEFEFGDLHLYLSTRFGLLARRITRPLRTTLAVYPSIIQMRQHEFMAFDRANQQYGSKRLHRRGHSYEFDQIKNYVRGDDYRNINWRATGRRAELMVNQFEDERARQVYCVIDKSRNMRMPFAGLTLLDHAINATLALSNIILKKHDRAGLITFADKLATFLRADSQVRQLHRILQALYREEERPLESDFQALYHTSRKFISGRSLLLLFTNFESLPALERNLPTLRRISAHHRLIVIFFENTEIRGMLERPYTEVSDLYEHTIARQFLSDKQTMVQRLQLHGIQAVLTRPADLTINTINKYLEIKARGII